MSASPQSALDGAGIPCESAVQVDDRVHRFKTRGDHDANCWYVFHQHSDFVCGAFGCWKRQFTQKWSDLEFGTMSADQKKSARLTWQEAAAKQREDQEKAQSDARASCNRHLLNWPSAREHDYLKAKGVVPRGTVKIVTTLDHVEGWLAIPLQDDKGVIHSCQFIAPEGTKRFYYGGRVQGCFFPIPGKPGPILICEGYATGCSLNEATGWSVICAMNCGNLLLVAQGVRRLNPGQTIVICADNDQFTEGNPGLEKAKSAAKSSKSLVVFPEFGDESMADKPTDFNDLHRLEGLGCVRLQVNRAFTIIGRPLGDFELPPENDPAELLKYRFLCRRGALLLTGPTGVGKSSFIMQALVLWANALPFFGIQPVRPLVSLLIQAENDDGDIAEMRNGVITGLKFTEAQRREAFAKVIVHSSTGLTGHKFCEEVVRPLLDLHGPDLLPIDPALSFLGGDVKEQKDVGNFLRQHLNPQLYAHDCACLMAHHTNKPKSGSDDSTTPLNGDWAYQGSGSAEWANWARAVISLQSTGTPGVYKLHAGKRGARIGWRDDQDQVLFEKIIVHSREKGVICWHEGEEGDLPYRGRPATYDQSKLVTMLGDSGLTTLQWRKQADSDLGLSKAQFYRILNQIQTSDSALKEVGSGKWVKVTKRPTVSEVS